MSNSSSAQHDNIRTYRDYYSKFAEDYEKRRRREARIIAETMAEWIHLDRLRILDFGVGTGSVWEHLYRKGVGWIHVVGLDIASGMIKIAKEKRIPWLQVLEMQVEDVDHADCFDVVCAHGLIKHCTEPANVIEKAHRVLTSGGYLFVEDLSNEDDAVKIARTLTAQVHNYLGTSRRSSSGLDDKVLLRIIQDAGFREQRQKRSAYSLHFESFKRIRDYFVQKMIFGQYTYNRIPRNNRKEFDEIFLQTLREILHKPIMRRRTFISLFTKA